MSVYANSNKTFEFEFGRNRSRMHSNFAQFEGVYWFDVVEAGFQTILGTAWYILMIATALTCLRIIRAHFKIAWSTADQLQMRQYMTTSFLGKLSIFLFIQSAMTFVWTKLRFTRGCLYYGIFGTIIAVIVHLVRSHREETLKRTRIRNIQKLYDEEYEKSKTQ